MPRVGGWTSLAVAILALAVSLWSPTVVAQPRAYDLLIDASRDGGVWWYPQSGGKESADRPHQGSDLGAYLDSQVDGVRELGRRERVDENLLRSHQGVLQYSYSDYGAAEIDAYLAYVRAGGRVVLVADHMSHDGSHDLAEAFGLRLRGATSDQSVAEVTSDHPLVAGMKSFRLLAGTCAVALPAQTTVLARYDEASRCSDTEDAAMGIFPWGQGWVVFLLEGNFLLEVPQPFADNLLDEFFDHGVTLGPLDPLDPQPLAALTGSSRDYAWLAASGLGAVALVAVAWPWAKFEAAKLLLLWPGYAKLRRSELLDHGLREALTNHIRAEPGISPPELQRATGAAWTTTVYHLRVLEENEIVSSLLDGRHRRFFPVGEVDVSQRPQVSVLRNERTRQVFEALQAEPGLGPRRLARKFLISPPAILWHLRRLESVGLVVLQRTGNRTHYFAQTAQAGTGPVAA